MGQELVDAMQSTITATAELCSALTDEQWGLATGCPGWSVRDVLAHLVGLEAALMNGGEPDHDLPPNLSHVTGPMSEYMERHVDLRRSTPPEDVLAEFNDVFATRIAAFHALPDSAFAEPTRGPMGSEVPLDRMLAIRVFDLWAHEQDIRRAVGKRGGLDSPAAEVAINQCTRASGPVIASSMPDGTTLALHLDGAFGGDSAWAFDGAKATRIDGPELPTVTLRADTETFATICCGRADARPDDVQCEGDAELATRAIAHLGFTP